MKAKERHELKQNDFADTMMRAVSWATAHRDRALTLGGVILVVILLVVGIGWWRQSRNDAAGALLGKAAAIAASPIAPASTLPGAAQQTGTFPTEEERLTAALAAYDEVISAYGGSAAAITARYAQASLLLEGRRAADADARFAQVIGEAGGSIYGPLAKLGRGQALVAQGKFDDAIALLTDLSADRTSRLPLDGILMQLAHANAKAGKTEDARAAFKRVVDEFPTSAYVAEARQELTRLGQVRG